MACLINENSAIENEFASPLIKNVAIFLSVNRGPNTYLGKVKKSREGDLALKGSTERSKWNWVLKTPPVSNTSRASGLYLTFTKTLNPYSYRFC